MKKINCFFLVALTLSLLLAGCGDSGGFSIRQSDETPVAEDTSPDPVSKPSGDGVYGGGAGTNSEDNPEDVTPPDETVPIIDTPQESQTIDLGNKLITFKLTLVKTDDTYVYFTAEDNPFDKKYNFGYYTIDNKQLDDSESILKEQIDEQVAYKLNIGKKESKTYTVQFYNKAGVEYGTAEITVHVQTVNHSFFNNMFGIVRIKVISIGVNIANQFTKIANVFRRIFGGSGLTMNK